MPAGYTYLGQLLGHDLKPAVSLADRPACVPLALETLLGPVDAPQRGPMLWQFPNRPAAFPFFSADLPRPFCIPGLGIATIPDLRNDLSPMLAQLSALFIAAAQSCERALTRSLAAPQARPAARAATVRMWHRILRADYLPRLCLPLLCQPDTCLPAAGPSDVTANPSDRFPAGLGLDVLRATQWMMRDQYRLGEDCETIAELLLGETDIERRRHEAGHRDFWRIDWRNFFALDPGHPPQRALSLTGAIPMIQPHNLAKDAAPMRPEGLERVDLTTDDVNQTGLATLVRQLAPQWRLQNPGWTLWSLRRRRALMQQFCLTRGLAIPPHLANDPPLYLYILAEAGATSASGTADGHGDGHRLGALGSVLLMASVHQAITTAEAALQVNDPTPLDAVDTLPALIRHLTPQA